MRGASNSTLDGFTIRDGYASEFTPPDNQGGGIYNTAASLVIRNCTLTVNQAEYGGGIYCGSGADALITNCVFDANSAPGGFGGGVCVEDSTTTIVACIFRNNAAPGAAGGALANISANTVVKNCLFHDNTATGGGAVSNEASSPSFTNCTFSDNNASSFGGAFYNFSNSDPVLVNCIVWQNKIAGVAAADMDEEFRNSDVNSSVTATYTMTAYAFAGTGNLTANPLFTTAGSVFTLQDGSFAIDVGTNAGVTSTDLVGNMRVVNGPDSGDAVTTAVVDMGCYENQVVGAILAPPIVNN